MLRAKGGHTKYCYLLHTKSEKTVAMVLLSKNGHISTAPGPNHMTQGPTHSQWQLLYLFPPEISEILTGGCGVRSTPCWGQALQRFMESLYVLHWNYALHVPFPSSIGANISESRRAVSGIFPPAVLQPVFPCHTTTLAVQRAPNAQVLSLIRVSTLVWYLLQYFLGIVCPGDSVMKGMGTCPVLRLVPAAGPQACDQEQ